MKITEIKKGELFIMTMTGAEYDKMKGFFDTMLGLLETKNEDRTFDN